MNSYIETAIDGATSTLHALAWLTGAGLTLLALATFPAIVTLVLRPTLHELHVRRTSRRLHREA